MPAIFPTEPGVSKQRIDNSQFAPALSSGSVPAYVFYAKRGSLKPKNIVDFDDMVTEYGRPDATVTMMHYCARQHLLNGGAMLGLRVTNGATYGGSAVLPGTTNVGSAAYPVAGVANSIDAADNPNTTIAPTGPALIRLTLSTALITANSFTATLNVDSDSAVIGPIVYATSSDNTINLIVTAINNAFTTLGLDGYAFLTETSNFLNINVYAPSSQQLSITGAAVTLGATQPVLTQTTALYYLQAENPGAWSSEIAHQAINPDMGTQEVISIKIPSAITATNTLITTINGAATSAIAYATSSDNTLQLIATAIAALTGVKSAVVTKVPLGASNDREIVVTMLRGNSTAATVAFTPASGMPTPVATQRIPGVTPDGSFTIVLYNKRAPKVAIESFRVNLTQRVDGNGVQQHIEDVINKGSGNSPKSRFVRALSAVAKDGSVNIPFDPTTGVIQAAPTYLSAGNDGSIPSAAQMVTAMGVLADTQRYPFNMLVSGGYTSLTYQQGMKNLAILRGNGTQIILDLPSNVQTTQDAIDYRLSQLAIDSAYGGAYLPDVEAQDPYTGATLWVPCSGHVAAQYAYNDAVRGIGKAPAGRTVGGIDTTRLRYEYSNAEMGKLFAVQLNCIMRRGPGFYIYGDTTLQVKQSALSFVSINRIIGFLEAKILDALDFHIFDPNDDAQALSITEEINRLLAPFIGSDGDLNRVEVRSNYQAGNTDGVIEQGNRIVQVYLDPKRSTRRILLQSIISRSGATFSVQESAS